MVVASVAGSSMLIGTLSGGGLAIAVVILTLVMLLGLWWIGIEAINSGR